MKPHTSSEKFSRNAAIITLCSSLASRHKTRMKVPSGPRSNFFLLPFFYPAAEKNDIITEEFLLFISVFPLCLFFFPPAVPPCGHPRDAGWCGNLVVQRPYRGQHQPGGHPRPLPGVASTEPAAVVQTRQRAVHHVRRPTEDISGTRRVLAGK